MENKQTIIDEVKVDEASGTILIGMRKIHTIEEYHRTSIPIPEVDSTLTAEELAEQQLDQVNRHLKAMDEAEVVDVEWAQVRETAKTVDVKVKKARKERKAVEAESAVLKP